MSDFLLSFLDFNSGVNYGTITFLIVFYVLVLWLIVSIWVYYDAKKRFDNAIIPVVLAVTNFILFFPFLFVYLLIRPVAYDDFDEWLDGGVNVPLVNFTGDDGVEMSFELKIHPKRLANNNDSEMKLDISFDSSDYKKELTNKNHAKPTKKNTKSIFRTLMSSIDGRFKLNKIQTVEDNLQNNIENVKQSSKKNQTSKKTENQKTSKSKKSKKAKK